MMTNNLYVDTAFWQVCNPTAYAETSAWWIMCVIQTAIS